MVLSALGRRYGSSVVGLAMLLLGGCAAPTSATSESTGPGLAATQSHSTASTAVFLPTAAAVNTTSMVTAASSPVGRSAAGSATSAPATGGLSTAAGTIYGQSHGACDGLAEQRSWSLLPAGAQLSAAVVCVETHKYVPGHGMWTYVDAVPLPPEKLPALQAGLLRPATPWGGGPCSGVLIGVPAFVVTLADGERVRPAVPSDGCEPDGGVIQVLDKPGAAAPLSDTRTTQVQGELETITGCDDGAKSPAIWIGPDPHLDKTGAVLPTAGSGSGSVSVCLYRGVPDQLGELARAGVVPVTRLQQLWQLLPAARPSACAERELDMTATATDWLMVLPTPRPPYQFGTAGSNFIALVEPGGCRRLFSSTDGFAGTVPAALGTALAALATRRP